MLRTIVISLAATLAPLLPAQNPAEPEVPPPTLGQTITALTEDPALANALVGFCLLDSDGEILATHNAHRALIPASALKTLTTATAFEVLGPQFTFTTELRSTVPMKDGILDGDLVILGNGDPTLTLKDLESWVQAFQDAGLKEITGRVIGDATHFPETIAGDFWDWSDVGNGYGAPIAGLNLNRNRYTAHFQAGPKEGDPATFLKMVPALPTTALVNRVTTGPDGSGDRVTLYGGPFATAIRAHGTVPLGSTDFTVDGAVPDPATFTTFHFDRLLRAAEITIGAQPLATYHEPTKAPQLLHNHSSAPLSEIIPHLHDISDNLEAEALYRTLGLKAKADPAAAIRAHWTKRGLALPSLRLVDGSGLGRANTISAHDLARLQHVAAKGPHGQLYQDSLISAADGRFRYKPGAMSGIHTFCGYVQNEQGQQHSFALLFNHAPSRQTTSLWTNRLLQAAAQ